MQVAILLVALCLFVVVAYGDVRGRRIPNELSLGIAALAALRMVLSGNPASAAITIAAGAMIFIVGYILFTRHVIGGGDVKLIAAAGLLVGYRDLLAFLLLMSLVGAAISFVMLLKLLAMRRARSIPGDEGAPVTVGAIERDTRPTVPYGVAIATAGICILLLQTSVIG